MLHGFEPCQPGWQHLQNTHSISTEEERLSDVQCMRGEAMWRASLRSETNLKAVQCRVKPGQWIVYFRSDYERKTGDDKEANRYSYKWSLPAKVEEVKNNICIVTDWGE